MARVTFGQLKNINGLDLFPNTIISKGNNMNGEWIKYADGTMICKNEIVKNYNFNTQYGSVYWTNETLIWNFPLSFIDIPIINVNILSFGILGTSQTPRTNKTAADFFVFNYKPENVANLKTKMIAIGKWK